ncbi:hypothetical protein DWF00_00540 [Bosea caraganae]|uniref:Uncharacterized protein n=1 Tax=Bosea caraganae TaxID=2763117 RepID=A0A370L8I3_9HYPH|nr:hypothetical protein [Bosea caraganae]RDJ26701.1 hypothetical protein DWE98_07555 [Bosea caraganae]RDJ30588.1 hypothetical protein DWF00_00540 [Bosea caraganae]
MAKLEVAHAIRNPARSVERHIIHGTDEAEREAKIAAIVAASPENVFYIFRMIISPYEAVRSVA